MKKTITCLIVILFLFIVQSYSSQVQSKESRPTITIPKISNPPKIDAHLDDECWSTATRITDFIMFEPVDGEPVSEKTEVFLAYDRENLYIAFRCYDSETRKIRSYISKRDSIDYDDRVGIMLDTFNRQRRSYGIEINALGIQMDWFYVEGKDIDVGLDMIFNSEGKLNSEGYTIEFAIPFKSLRFPPGDVHTIGLAVFRVISRRNEIFVWPPMDRSKNTLLDQLAQIIRIEGIEYSRNIEILPSFTAVQTGRLNAEDIFKNSSPDSDFGVGLKYNITPNITIDFTYNPDFSQVEADVGQVDINQRYELYYDEKRPFFLEGADVFLTDIEAFYSRRIIDPLLGAKITGKIGNASFGFLSALDKGTGRECAAEDNPHLGEKALFNILRGTYDLFSNSYIGFLMTSRQFADSSNQVVGIDGSFNFKQKYRFSFQGLESFSTNEEGANLRAPSFKTAFSRTSRHLTYSFTYRDLYPDFRADAGFIKRTDIREGVMEIGYRFIPNNKWIIDYIPNYEFSRMYDHNGIMVEQRNKGSIELHLRRNTSFTFALEKVMEQWLAVDFEKQTMFITLTSDPNKYVSTNIDFQRGESIFYDRENPYLGYQRYFQGQIKVKPNTRLIEELSFTKSTFWREKDGEKIYDYNIIRSKTFYNFNKKLFLRAIFEYNTYWKELSTDILLSYMHNYGTVFFLGYGGLFDRDEQMHFHQNKRSFFIKLSYLWRL